MGPLLGSPEREGSHKSQPKANRCSWAAVSEARTNPDATEPVSSESDRKGKERGRGKDEEGVVGVAKWFTLISNG